jgi:hypothetical protein
MVKTIYQEMPEQPTVQDEIMKVVSNKRGVCRLWFTMENCSRLQWRQEKPDPFI